ncbi:MAG: GDSL-type esterase/lipase family protein [Planctomycetota bacterium]|nr:GDSL-type esterase/lipase family protein [Planctomycetota bacterium]
MIGVGAGAGRAAWVVIGVMLLAGVLRAGEADLIKNGDFKDGTSGWSELASDADREAAVVDFEGGKALKLARKTAKAAAQAVQYNLKLKPQTLYRLSVTGKGDTRAVVSLRPSSSKDKDYFKLCKSWATSAAPLDPSKDLATETLLFDAGQKADSAFLALRLDGEAPGTYQVTSVALTEVGGTKADKSELVIAHLGDSITITSYLPFSQRVDALLQAAIQKAFPNLRTRQLNLAADGEFVKELFDTKRYDQYMKENYDKIDVAIIRYGGNDQPRYSADEFKKLLNALCDNLIRDYPGITIVLGTGTCLNAAGDINKKYGPYWQATRDLANERKFLLADVYRRFEKEASPKTAKAEGDMHPSAFGVKLTAEVEYETLEAVLKAR